MNNLDLLIPRKTPAKGDWYTWATVTAASPLAVRLDGDTAALASTPSSLVRNLAVNDRVWVQVSGRRVVIQGRSGGQTVDTTVTTSLIPTGGLLPYGGAAAPTGYLLCDGTSYSTTAQAALFSVIGYTYGGSGSSFFVPDMRARLPIGAGTDPIGDGGSIIRGARGGAFKLTTAELPSHTHGVGTLATGAAGSHRHVSNGNFTFGLKGDTTATAGQNRFTNFDDGNTRYTDTAPDHSHTITGATAATGSGNAHLPAYVGLNYIIKS